MYLHFYHIFMRGAIWCFAERLFTSLLVLDTCIWLSWWYDYNDGCEIKVERVTPSLSLRPRTLATEGRRNYIGAPSEEYDTSRDIFMYWVAVRLSIWTEWSIFCNYKLYSVGTCLSATFVWWPSMWRDFPIIIPPAWLPPAWSDFPMSNVHLVTIAMKWLSIECKVRLVTDGMKWLSSEYNVRLVAISLKWLSSSATFVWLPSTWSDFPVARIFLVTFSVICDIWWHCVV